MMLLKLPGLRKLSALNEKKMTMTTSPTSTGQLPRFPARKLSSDPSEERLGQDRLRRERRSVVAHTGGSGSVEGMPDTFVGTPAVIACTTSCWVVAVRS